MNTKTANFQQHFRYYARRGHAYVSPIAKKFARYRKKRLLDKRIEFPFSIIEEVRRQRAD